MKEILQLANQGDTDAQCLMGNMYDRGVVMPQDYPEAVRWFRLAALAD